MRHRCRRVGYTLVELLIVIAAIAIFAGMVIPEVGSAVEDANRSAVLANLRELTSAIERYRIQHNGVPPDDLTGKTLPQLTSQTDVYGNIGTGSEYIYGPYIIGDIPENPLNQSSVVTKALTAPPTNRQLYAGWIYDLDSGQIWAGEGSGNKTVSLP
jgi:prepilin-type N-terminal cleavage/methylation domain-containing protein